MRLQSPTRSNEMYGCLVAQPRRLLKTHSCVLFDVPLWTVMSDPLPSLAFPTGPPVLPRETLSSVVVTAFVGQMVRRLR